MIVTIAGATGILGRHLIPMLIHDGIQVRAMARSAERIKEKFGVSVEAVEADLLQPGIEKVLAEALPGSDVVLHLATAIPVNRQQKDGWTMTARLRTEGTRTLLNAALSAGVLFYLQQSIELAYPDRGEAWIDEQTALDSRPDRAEINQPVIEMESMVRAIPGGQMGWCILRGGTFVGPGTFQDQVIERLRNGDEMIPCDGHNYVSYIHVADMASAVLAAVHKQPTGAILNINAEPVRQADYLNMLAEILGAPRLLNDASIPCPRSIRCSTAAAQRILGWKASHSIWPDPDDPRTARPH